MTTKQNTTFNIKKNVSGDTLCFSHNDLFIVTILYTTQKITNPIIMYSVIAPIIPNLSMTYLAIGFSSLITGFLSAIHVNTLSRTFNMFNVTNRNGNVIPILFNFTLRESDSKSSCLRFIFCVLFY